MRFERIALLAVILFVGSTMAAQDVYVENNYLAFSSIAAYDAYAANEADRGNLVWLTYNDWNVTTRAEAQYEENDEELYPDFLNLVLNQDNIVRIGSFLVKVDMANSRGLAINANEPNAYWTLYYDDMWAPGVIYFDGEQEDALEVLESYENGWIAYSKDAHKAPRDTVNGPASKRGRVTANGSCRGADRKKCESEIFWDAIDRPGDWECPQDIYRMDYKVVYQKALIYFSLQSKAKSRVACPSTNWVLVPTYDAQLRLDGNTRYKKRCGAEVVKTQVLNDVNRVIDWRPYESSRSLSQYEFNVTFSIDHPGNVPPANSASCSIVDGYSVTPPAGHPGMTWRATEQRSGPVTHVASDNVTNPYSGDTPASASLPVLCLRVTNAPAPSNVSPDFYNGWAKGSLAITAPVTGSTLTSRATADALCSSTFGGGWRMAEFHDGFYGTNLASSGGWSYWGYGNIPIGQRMWVAINDQPANPWN